MRFIVGWDDVREIESIGSFLNVGGNAASVFTDAAEFESAYRGNAFDAALLALNFPSPVACFPLYQRLREIHPDTPIVGAGFAGEITHVAKFILAGLHSYLLRDAHGEFVLLLTTVLEAAHHAVVAQRARLLAEKLREEIESVRQLQSSVIPAALPRLPGYRLVARYEPSQISILGDHPVAMAGGDYYDAFRVGDTSLILMLGDAAGHGVKACMSIMTMHTLIDMIRNQTYANTAEFVSDVNRRLCHSSIVAGEGGGFITLLYGSLDLARHELEWTSAGHPLPLLHDLDTNEVRPLGSAEQSGLPLVVSDGWTYRPCRSPFPPGSRLLLYTDGLEEAFPGGEQRHQQFGVRGIIDTLRRHARQPIETVMDELFAASHAATAGAGRMDDTSIMILERLAPSF